MYNRQNINLMHVKCSLFTFVKVEIIIIINSVSNAPTKGLNVNLFILGGMQAPHRYF